ncbi:MAG: hypothetical protein IPN30_09855 [Flavobacteriales bacterium]|nr:hypothetical protein [Flavobacteriales bacterium]
MARTSSRWPKAPNGDLYAGGEMLYRSVDGVHWTLSFSQGFPDNEMYVTDASWSDRDGRVIVTTDEDSVFATLGQPGGQNWNAANSSAWRMSPWPSSQQRPW